MRFSAHSRRRRTERRLDARVGRATVLVDEAVTPLDAKGRRAVPGGTQRRHPREALDSLVLRTRVTVGAASGATAGRRDNSDRTIERDGRDLSVLGQRIAAALDLREPGKSEAPPSRPLPLRLSYVIASVGASPSYPRQLERIEWRADPWPQHSLLPRCGRQVCPWADARSTQQRHHAPSQSLRSCSCIHTVLVPAADAASRRCLLASAGVARLIDGIRRKSTRREHGDRVGAA